MITNGYTRIPLIKKGSLIGDIYKSPCGRYEYILGTDRNGKLMWIEGELKVRTL